MDLNKVYYILFSVVENRNCLRTRREICPIHFFKLLLPQFPSFCYQRQFQALTASAMFIHWLFSIPAKTV